MSQKANPAAIGAFTLGAIALLVAAGLVLGSGRLLTQHTRAVAYFEGDIQGLAVGSAVDLRGVQVGTVTGIGIRVDLDTMEPLIPVFMELDPNHFDLRGGKETKGDGVPRSSHEELLKRAVESGLRARLATQSLVTGQLIVELDLDRNEPRHVVGADPSAIEIPTSDSDIQKLKNVLGRIPLERIAASLLRTLDDADRLVSSPEIPRLLQSLAHASDSLDRLLTSLNADVDPLVANANHTMTSAQDALADARRALTEMRSTLATASHLMATSVDEAAKGAAVTLQKADKVFADADGLIGANSPQRYDIDQMLRNLAAATHALRIFADDLQRKPNNIVMGK
jgi:phospholipid/cholesterol/gamma-HCH transport system substrate-binding protein